MMGPTHRAFSGAFWLGSTLVLDYAVVRTGHSAPVHPVAVLGGTFIAPWFSAGHLRTRVPGLSPDLDHMWAPGPPARDYDWRRHRGFTHRVWFASLLSLVFAFLPALAVSRRIADPLLLTILVPLICAPVNGWWSHLFGDMIYGRIKVGWYFPRLGRFWTWNIGLGWETGGLSEKGGRWLRDPAAKACLGATAVLSIAHLYLVTI